MKLRFSRSETTVRLDLRELELLASGSELRETFPLPGGERMEWLLSPAESERISRGEWTFRLEVPRKILESLAAKAAAGAPRSELEASLGGAEAGVTLEVDFLDARKMARHP